MRIKPIIFSAALALLIGVSGCTNVSPRLDPSITPPLPVETATPAVTDEPSAVPETEEPTPNDATQDPAELKDVLGNTIYGSDHYERYISFGNILVYEENGGTFVDCTVDNSYPKMLLCAVNIVFYAEDGSIIASSSLQMPDGSFMLALGSGKTTLFARVPTDTVLTDKPFKLFFDAQTGVKPQQ